MSTPPSTETFVTGDRFIYKFDGNSYSYTGTIKSVHPRLEGWYVVDCDGYGESALPGDSNMEKLEYEYSKVPEAVPVTLSSGPSLEEIKALLSEVTSTLEGRLMDVSRGMADPNIPQQAYDFDAGFTAGLRVALNDLAKLSESL